MKRLSSEIPTGLAHPPHPEGERSNGHRDPDPSWDAGDRSSASPRNRAPLNDAGQRLGLSVDDAAWLLGISRDLAYDLVAAGQIPSVRLGRRIVVPRRALERVLDERLDSDGRY